MQQVINISIEQYKDKIIDDEVERKLLKAEKQIEERKTIKATDVFKELEEKYGFWERNIWHFPNIYAKIEKKDIHKRDFRRMVIDNFVVLYTVDENSKKVYIAHMHYGRRNYL